MSDRMRNLNGVPRFLAEWSFIAALVTLGTVAAHAMFGGSMDWTGPTLIGKDLGPSGMLAAVAAGQRKREQRARSTRSTRDEQQQGGE